MTILPLILSAVLAGIFFYGKARWLRSPVSRRAPAPGSFIDVSDLRPVEVAASELSVTVTDMVRLSVRVDEVWRDSTGALIPVETKTHERITDADRIQLSVGGYALRKRAPSAGSAGTPLFGVVRLAPPSGMKRNVAIPLLDDTQVEALIARYVSLRYGLAAPRTAPSKKKCATCAFQSTRCTEAA
jgi:hypothetical protein